MLGVQTAGERNEARRQAALARSVNALLTDDLLGRGNPARTGKSDETLMDAAAAAEEQLMRRPTNEPQVAASISWRWAKSSSRGAFDLARDDYQHAAAAFARVEGPDSANVVIMTLHEAQTEAMAAQRGSIARAARLLRDMAPRLSLLGRRTPKKLAWYLAAGATVSLMDGELEKSHPEIASAAAIADRNPAAFDAGIRMTLHQREAVTLIRGGHWDSAETLLRRLRSESEGDPDRQRISGTV